MSHHFSANQYEAAFSPQRLQNYQVPLQHKEHPSMRSGCTQIISNERGHLNTHIPRSLASPWGSFAGTWQAKRKPIQLKTRTKLMTHLAQMDRGGSTCSSRATSARVSHDSQRVTNPRPQSAQVSREEDKPISPDDGSKPPTPATESSSKLSTPATDATSKPPATSMPPTPATPAIEATSRPPTPAAVATSRPQSPVTSKPLTPGDPHPESHDDSNKPPQGASQTTAPQNIGSRITSATSTRSSMSRTPISSVPSRVQSATTVRTPPPHQSPPDTAQSRVSSAALSSGRQSSTSSTRASSPGAAATPSRA